MFRIASLPCLCVGLSLAAPMFAQQPDYQRLFDEHYLPRVTEVLKRGQYETAQAACQEAIDRGQTNARWRILLLQAMEGQGATEEIVAILPDLTSKFPDDLPMQMEIHRQWIAAGKPAEAAELLKGFNTAALKKPLKDRNARELVAMGQAAFALGADPGRVLDEFFGAAKKKEPALLETYLAAGNLALEKYDYARASQEFREGLKQSATDPDLRFGLARALFPSDREQAGANLDRVLGFNANHFPALLLKTEHSLTQERHDEAAGFLDRIDAVNPKVPVSWAFRSVIAVLLHNDEAAAKEARDHALSIRAENPEVPHALGRILSKRYRFEEGAALQRQALQWRPGFVAAKMQLASDLMRLGHEEEAFVLAKEVTVADSYNVLAFNYLKLQEQMAKYKTVTQDGFIVRMRPEDYDVYGDRALNLLQEAHAVLTAKYGLKLEKPTLVEFFAEQQDFAIRTFGELGGEGYLGVCFGPVITLNSPGASASGMSNWEATLWHEFCHVVTLTATKNRMPRWLSEGISVYEESERNPLWGQRMTSSYRRRILEDKKLTPVGEMSNAFMHAESGEDVMFAYYQSALIVKFLLETYGQPAFNGILAELAKGEPINKAIVSQAGDMAAVEVKFAAYAAEVAAGYGPGVDWTQAEDLDPENAAALLAYVAEHPNNHWAWQRLTIAQMQSEAWPQAIESAQKLIALFPDYVEENSGYLLLAQAYRGAKNTDGEAQAWRELAQRRADAAPAYLRLMEIDLEKKNWPALLENSDRQMAVNPFLKNAHYCQACAAQALGKNDTAIKSYETLLKLGAPSPAEVNYQLGVLFQDSNTTRAKRHVLDALVDAPRFRDAYALLKKLNTPPAAKPAAPTPTPAPGPAAPPVPTPIPTPAPASPPPTAAK